MKESGPASQGPVLGASHAAQPVASRDSLASQLAPQEHPILAAGSEALDCRRDPQRTCSFTAHLFFFVEE